MTKYIINCQSKEWYGCCDNIGNPAYGRYKMNGGQSFIIEAEDSLMYDEEYHIASFNKKYDRLGRYMRYEAKSVDWYEEPIVAKFIDGEIIIPFIERIDGTSL